jgi:Flp pilus assembly protein TadG
MEGNMNRTTRSIRHDRGAVAVEFALIMPLLLLILFGTIEFGRVWSQYQVFNGAAREGARCAAVQAGDFATCDIQGSIEAAAGPYAGALPSGRTVTVGGAAAPDGCTSDDQIGLPVQVAWDQPLNITIPFWGDVTISPTIEATFRCE